MTSNLNTRLWKIPTTASGRYYQRNTLYVANHSWLHRSGNTLLSKAPIYKAIYSKMNIEDIREYCLAKPHTDEAFPFDETTLVFRLMGKIFACLDLERPNLVVLKCEPDYALELRDRYRGIEGAWHWNKKHWNQIYFDRDVPDTLIYELIDHSYEQVYKKIPRKVKAEYEEQR